MTMPCSTPEARRAYNQAYYAAHAEHLRTRERERQISKGPEGRAARKALNKEWRGRNKERLRVYSRARYLADPVGNLLRNAKARAREQGLAFELTREDIVVPALCPVFGVPLVIGTRTGWVTPTSPTLDRVDNTRGYVRDNVCVISWRANELKGSASLEEVERVAEYMRRHMKKRKASR